MATRESDTGLRSWFGRATQWVQRQKPVRVAMYYSEERGPILASGLAFQGIFAIFAGLWVGFAIAGLVISGNLGLRRSIIDFLGENVPGLIGDGDTGVIAPEVLFSATVFGGTGALALLILVLTALNWLASARSSVRSIFDLPPPPTNIILLRLKDLGLAIAYVIVLIVSALLSVAGTQATGWLLEVIGVGEESTVATVLGRIVTLSVMFALDVVVLASLYRVLSGVHIPWASLRTGVLIAAVGLGTLKILGGVLLAGAERNPLLASFAVLIGLLIWINLACQVILAGSAWIAVGMKDKGIEAKRMPKEE